VAAEALTQTQQTTNLDSAVLAAAEMRRQTTKQQPQAAQIQAVVVAVVRGAQTSTERRVVLEL
jgi:hypothetical protein